MAWADLGGGAVPGRARHCYRVAGTLEAGWRRWRSNWRWRMPESEPARLTRRLLPCTLTGFVEPEGVESDRGLNGDGAPLAT
jgi:hypothetical protein